MTKNMIRSVGYYMEKQDTASGAAACDLCNRVAGSAGSYGQRRIGECAGTIYEAIQGCMDAGRELDPETREEIYAEVRSLESHIRREFDRV